MKEITVKTTAEGERFERLIDELTKSKLSIGFKPGEHIEENGMDVAEVAFRNEFGDDNVPARPFMAQAIDNHPKEIDKIVSRATRSTSAQAILNSIGEGIVELIKAEIDNGDFVPNAPATVAAKGSDKPLIDTGMMRDSIEHWITKG